MKILEHGEPGEASDKALALEIGRVLERAYPNHPWIVGFQSGGLVIRHLSIAAEVGRVLKREGFASLLPRDRLGTPTEVTHTAKIFAGELLEAFGLKRGPWDGTPPTVPESLRSLNVAH